MDLQTAKDWADMGYSISEVIEKLDKLKPTCPRQPKHPVLKPKHSSEEVKKYVSELITYEDLMIQYDIDIMVFEKECLDIDNIIEDFIKDKSGFNLIPEQYKNKVWTKALLAGQSNGYAEIYSQLYDLVDLFS